MKHLLGCLSHLLFLATLVVMIFFIPNLIGKWLVKPAVMADSTGFYNHPSEVDVHVSAWHGFDSPELWMTIGIVGVGSVLFLTMSRWQKLIRYSTAIFITECACMIQQCMFGEDGMNRLSRFYMTGSNSDIFNVYVRFHCCHYDCDVIH